MPEALVYLGTGGASTDEMTVMRMEDHTPVLAVFIDRAGKASPVVLLEGASAMHGNGVQLLPEQHAVYAFHYNYGGNGKLDHCGGEAYTCNAQTKIFNFNTTLTKKLTQITCRQVPKTVE